MRYGTNSTRLRHNNGGSSSSDTTYNSQESLRALAKRYGINQKTVAKWKKRSSVADYWLRVFPTEETYLQALVIANLLLLPPDPV